MQSVHRSMKLKTPPSTVKAAPSALRFADYETQRGTARERGYDGWWARYAKRYRTAHPLCLGCEAVGRYEATAVVDHIEPHKRDRVLFREPSNHQPACAWHHNKVKQQLENRWMNGEIDVADLRLDSAVAQELTRSLLAMGRGGRKSGSPSG